MFPEKTFYNYDKLAFSIAPFEAFSSTLNKSNDDGRLSLFLKVELYFQLVMIKSIKQNKTKTNIISYQTHEMIFI